MKAEISVMFNVKDVDRSVAFYRALGFTTRWEWKGDEGKLEYAGVGIGGAVIALGRITPGPAEGVQQLHQVGELPSRSRGHRERRAPQRGAHL